MYSVKVVLHSLLFLLLASSISGCSSHMISGAVRSADYERHDQYDKWRHRVPNYWPHTDVYTETPQSPFVVVGTVEVRTSRPVVMSKLIEELRSVGRRALHADAVMPARQKKRDDGDATSSANPLRRFYVFDDGKTQILEAEAIRFTAPPQ